MPFSRLMNAVALALLLAACTTPYRPAVQVRASAPFTGLHALLAQGRPLDIVLVHGMCTHDPAWAHATVDAIMATLAPGYAAVQRAAPPAAPGRIQIVRRDETARGVPVHFTALVWSPLTAGIKSELDGDKTGVPTDCASASVCKPRRAKLNGLLKDMLLDDCLADAVIYLGASRDAIRAQMMAALADAVTPGAQSTMVLIAESLGSKLTFDALVAMLRPGAAPEETAAAASVAARLVQVFMGSNQLPLLGLAERTPFAGATRAAQTDALQDFLALRRSRVRTLEREAAPLTIVAFTDPNDLLSYRLRATRYAQPGVKVADVLVSNRSTILGLIEDPFGAHVGYRDNPDVARLIVCGSGPCAP